MNWWHSTARDSQPASGRSYYDNEPFSTAERSERVENFLFRATHKHTEAGIEEATIAMRCHDANSPEPRGCAVPGSDASALRAADQQLYNCTSLTSWVHRGSLSKQRELVLSSLPPPPPFRRFSAKVACLFSLHLLSTCMYNTFSHITFLGYNHMNSRASVFLNSLLSEHISSDDTCVLGGGSFPVTTHVFSSRGVASVRARRLFPLTISGVRGSVPVLPLGRKLNSQPVLSRASRDSHLAV